MEKMQGNGSNNQQEEISLKELILKIKDCTKYLLSKWYILLLAGVIGGVIGFFYAKSKKMLYTATTTFVLEGGESARGLGQYAGIAAMAGVDLRGGDEGIFQGNNLLKLYKSRKMVESALLKPLAGDSSKLLIDCYLKWNKIRERWKENSPQLLDIDFKNNKVGQKRSRDSVIREVVAAINEKNLIVENIDKKSSITKVIVTSESEIFSKNFNEAIVNEVNRFYISTKTKKSLDNIYVLQRKADSVRKIMDGSILESASIMDATPNLNLTRQVQRIAPSQRSQFSAETNKVILGQLVQNLEITKMALMKESPLIQKIDEPIYPLDVKKVSVLKFTVLAGLGMTLVCMIFMLIVRFYKVVMYP